MRDAERRLGDRPARGVGGQVAERERHRADGEQGDGARDPAGRVGGAPAEPGAPGSAARRRRRGEARGDEQQPAEHVPDAREVAPVRTGVDDVEPVGDEPEAEDDQPEDDTGREPRRPRRARRGSAHPAARRRSRRRRGSRSRPGQRQVEEVDRDQREAGEEERALRAARCARGGSGASLNRARRLARRPPCSPADGRAWTGTPRYGLPLAQPSSHSVSISAAHVDARHLERPRAGVAEAVRRARRHDDHVGPPRPA